jgi:hypothetical protein
MPNCDFYAAGTDHQAILQFLLSRGDCDFYELYSRFDQPLRQFHSLSDFEQHYSIADWKEGANESILLQLHPHGANGHVATRRIDLNPDACPPATFRYACEGWGLVQLYLEPLKDGSLRPSHTNHNSERRAKAWSDAVHDVDDPAGWDWPRVTSFSRRLNRFIRSLAVAKAASRVILPHAAELQRLGVKLLLN